MTDTIEQNNDKGILSDFQNLFTSSAKNGKQIFYYTGKKQSIKIPQGIKTIFLTMISAGGAGASGGIDCNTHMHFSGGSGGSGGNIISLPIQVESGVIVDIYVGCGKVESDGESSIIEVRYSNNQRRRISVEGGKRAIGIHGGKGGKSPYSPQLDGLDGMDGNFEMPSCEVLKGVNGANSIYAKGGLGTNQMPSPTEGVMGSGGGSSSSAAYPGAKGGNGFITIEFA